MSKWFINIPPGLDKAMADNWRNVQAALGFVSSLDNTVNSKTTGLAVVKDRVKVSSTDSTANYLTNKITAGTGITKTKSLTGGTGEEILTLSIGAHADLTDMPDTTGVITDHDQRYVVQQSASAPTVPAPYEGMLWYDTDAPEPEIFLIGDGAAGVDFQIKVDGETNDGVITWMEDEDQFKFSDRLQTDGGIIGKITTVADTYIVLVSDETVICNKATNFTVTLPTATVGQKFTIKNIGVGVVTVDGDGTDTIDGSLTQSLIQWESFGLQCYVANKWGVE